jgi:hypothetical protein
VIEAKRIANGKAGLTDLEGAAAAQGHWLQSFL